LRDFFIEFVEILNKNLFENRQKSETASGFIISLIKRGLQKEFKDRETVAGQPRDNRGTKLIKRIKNKKV
jgi:hypothetical protein